MLKLETKSTIDLKHPLSVLVMVMLMTKPLRLFYIAPSPPLSATTSL